MSTRPTPPIRQQYYPVTQNEVYYPGPHPIHPPQQYILATDQIASVFLVGSINPIYLDYRSLETVKRKVGDILRRTQYTTLYKVNGQPTHSFRAIKLSLIDDATFLYGMKYRSGIGTELHIYNMCVFKQSDGMYVGIEEEIPSKSPPSNCTSLSHIKEKEKPKT